MEIVLIVVAVLVLLIAGVVFAFSMRKPNVAVDENTVADGDFETKYDELSHLYSTGRLSEDEYREAVKYIIN